MVVDAASGVEVGTEAVWRLADERKLPRMVFVNQMDRENANYDATLDQLKAAFGPKIAPVYLPIGSAETFRGYIDVVEQHATVYEGGQPKEVPIPDEMRSAEEGRRQSLIEAAAEASDELMMKYLEGEEVSDEEIETALHAGTRDGSVVPVFVGSALKNIGVRELTRMIARHIPSPAEVGARKTTDDKVIEPDPSGPFVAQVFKVTADPFIGRLTYRVVSGTLKAQGHPQRESPRGRADQKYPGRRARNSLMPAVGNVVAVAKLASTHYRHPGRRSRLGRPAHTAELPAADAAGCDRAGVQGRPRQVGPGLNWMVEEEPCMRVTPETPLVDDPDCHGRRPRRCDRDRLKRKLGRP